MSKSKFTVGIADKKTLVCNYTGFWSWYKAMEYYNKNKWSNQCSISWTNGKEIETNIYGKAI
ncbi:hypothetical protein [Flammeovirga sp. OC4]|uniref:hypothetical protein n=1 Tax=Flammeovirga sp. OC4 TaxID=1382345 RepID=UPI0005C4CAE3|nr:hypothetical protein [Flammeovirga sp. OC4]